MKKTGFWFIGIFLGIWVNAQEEVLLIMKNHTIPFTCNAEVEINTWRISILSESIRKDCCLWK